MKINASILALAVPVAMLAACNRAESPNADNAVNDSTTMSPAAATGTTGVDTNSTGGVNVNSPGVTDQGVGGEVGAAGTSPMANPGNATGAGPSMTPGAQGHPNATDALPAESGATGSSMPNGAQSGPRNGMPNGATNGMPSSTPNGMSNGTTPANKQSAPADEQGHPKRPAG